MGFGSGGGGFTPSPNFIPSSTTQGAALSDQHQVTGSLDITGSLKINGVQITTNGGGGGGTSPGGSNTQVQFNNGGNFGGSANFTFDGNAITVSDDADVVTTLGRAKIGYNGTTSDTAIFAHRDMANTANYALSQNQNGDTIVNAKNGRSLSLRLNNNNALVIAGAANNNVGINTGSPQARLHVSTNTGEKDVFRADGDTDNILFVSGSGKVGIGTGTPTATLHVSGAAPTTDPLFRIDQHDQAGSKPILYVTGSGLVGIGTGAPRTDTSDTNRLHILGESGADQGQDPVANTLLMLENNDHVGVQFMTPTDKSGFLVWGDADAARVAHFYFHHDDNRFHFDGNTYGHEAMTVRASGDSINMGTSNSAHMDTAKAALHISSSTGGTDVGGPVLLRVDHKDQPLNESLLFITGSGHVGIGTSNPRSRLTVVSTGSQARFSYDDNNHAFVTVASDGDLTISGSATLATSSLVGADVHIDAAKHIKFQSDAGAFHFQRPGNTNRFIVDTSGGEVYLTNIQNTDMIFRIGAGQAEVARFDQSELSFRLPNTNPLHFRNTATAINSPAANKLHVKAPELVITGSTIVSGAFGNTDFENVSVAFTILSPSGTTFIDTTSLANNATYTYSIEDGSFVGQEKKIFGKVNYSAGDTVNSNALQVTGSNIEGTTFGPFVPQLQLSSSNAIGGANLVWSGTKWLTISVNQMSIF